MTPTERVRLVTRTLENCGRDLQPFSNTQVAAGIGFMLWEIGGVLYDLYKESVPLEDKRAAIASIAALYHGIFAVRCENCDANEEMHENRLHFRCYMLWDAGCVCSYGLRNDPLQDKILLINTIFDVLEAGLQIPHQQCQQSALHGFGHEIMSLHNYDDEAKTLQTTILPRVLDIIDHYIARTDIEPWLREYAGYARTGCVQ